MKSIFNSLFSFLKYILLLGAFAITLFIIVQMYQRLGKNIVEASNVFIPYLLLLILFMINFMLKQTTVTKNIFYNITCCLVFTTVLVIGARAIFDDNMVLNMQLGRNINFNFFDYFLPFMKILFYGLIGANLFLMFDGKSKKSKPESKKPIVEQIV